MTFLHLLIHAFVFVAQSKAVSSQEVHPDIRAVVNVPGIARSPGGRSWADSYSVGNNCYCNFSTFDHRMIDFMVEVPSNNGKSSWMTVKEVCNMLGDGPGIDGRPLYNDVQCGNGPPNDAGDEHLCPGRVDIGQEGCGHIGPKWNFFARTETVVEAGVDDEGDGTMPEWWPRVAGSYVGTTSLAQCWKKQGDTPNDGSGCGRKEKVCFFGTQNCPQLGPNPATRCICGGSNGQERWTCVNQACANSFN